MRASSLFLSLVLAAVMAVPAVGGDIPLIDAHSQMDGKLDVKKIVPLMDKAGVRMTILGTRGRGLGDSLDYLVATYPGRIVPAVRLKGKPYKNNDADYYYSVRKQLSHPEFGAIGEALVYHAKKGQKAPEVVVYPDERQVQFALQLCTERGWPLILHIEFAAAKSKRQKLMEKLEALLRENPDSSFALIHMGQLGPGDVGRLISVHDNLYFMTSHCNPVHNASSSQPWINLFDGQRLATPWRQLMEQHSDRFIFALDNVEANDWGKRYLKQAALWQKAFADLPPQAAHRIAHGNAERLWKLDPVR